MSTRPGSSAAQRAKLASYAARVRASPHNLVSRRALEDLESRHIPEAVALALSLPVGPARVLDVGTGGGLPGFVIATVRSDLEVHLLDATAKKTAFLQECAVAVEVPVVVHRGRAEDLARSELSGTFDVVTARAVAPLSDLIGYTVPFLTRDGVVYAVKGERWPSELADAESAIRRHGAVVLGTPDDRPQVAEGHDAIPPPRVVMLGRAP